MEDKLSLAEGTKLVKLARKSISYKLATNSQYSETTTNKKLGEQRGVFVTLNSFPDGDLRGCIGLPYPIKPLWPAVAEAAVSAATRDPRFNPVNSGELENISIEISVLTVPVKIKKSELPEAIKIGEHGLIVRKGGQSGLLLPQVATEYTWNAETFLEQTCRKAGLFEKAWKQDDCEIEVFSAQIFKETKPEGKITEEKN